MDINALALSQATPVEGAAAVAKPPEKGFAQALESVQQSGAPPGPPSPPGPQAVGEEVATPGPNAQTQNPDFLPQTGKGDAATAGVKPLLSSKIPEESAATADDASTDEVKAHTREDANPFAADIAAIFGGSVAPPIVQSDVAKAVGMPVSGQDKVQPKILTQAPVIQDAKDATDPAPQSAAGRPIAIPPTVNRDLYEKYQALIKEAGNVCVQNPPRDSSNGVRTDADSATGKELPGFLVDKLHTPPSEPVPILIDADQQLTPPSQIKTTFPAASDMADAQSPTTDALSGSNVKGPRTKASKDSWQFDKSGKLKTGEKTSADGILTASDEDSEVPATAIKDVKHVSVIDARPQASAKETATVAKAQPDGPLDRKDYHLVVRQIADRMELLAASRPKQGVTIQLQPEHLGNIEMTIKSLGGAIEAQISASDDRVRTALQQNGSALVQSMGQRGIKLDSVTITPQAQQASTSHREAGQQQQHQQQQHQQSQTYRSGHGTSYSSGRSSTLSGASDSRRMAASMSGVDYWI